MQWHFDMFKCLNTFRVIVNIFKSFFCLSPLLSSHLSECAMWQWPVVIEERTPGRCCCSQCHKRPVLQSDPDPPLQRETHDTLTQSHNMVQSKVRLGFSSLYKSAHTYIYIYNPFSSPASSPSACKHSSALHSHLFCSFLSFSLSSVMRDGEWSVCSPLTLSVPAFHRGFVPGE